MNKEHFVNLLNYDRWASNRLLQAMESEGIENPKALRLFMHTFDAQQVWHDRIRHSIFKEKFDNSLPSYQDGDLSVAKAKEKMDEVHIKLDRLIDYIEEARLEKSIAYASLEGGQYLNSLEDILTHIVNHGTHHRAQISALLRSEGHTPPQTDYIYFTRFTK